MLTGLSTSLTTAAAMGAACSVLSVFVVLRRWAFIGEGIAHAGFGGAGTAWMLALLFPGVALFQSSPGVYLVAVVFSLAVAVGMALITRRENVRSDSAIGIFLVASLAWGFLGQKVYEKARNVEPAGWGEMLFGHVQGLATSDMLVALGIAAAVLLVVGMLGKEIVYYTFDPGLAEISGVRVAFIHHLLILLVALTIILGMRLMGSVLVAAMLVLPGATALLLSRDLKRVLIVSLIVGLIGALVGPLVHYRWDFIPAGPAIVLALVGEFLLIYAWRAVRRSAALS